MHDATGGRWPRFEMVTFSAPTGIPNGWVRELVSKGVPKDLLLGAYRAAHELALVEVPGGEQFICFGTCGPHDVVCLDPRTGAVVDLLNEATESINQVSNVLGPPLFVNSSLEQFIASVRAVTARFPFDSDGTGQSREAERQEDEWAREDRLDNERFQAADELVETLRCIDPAATADLDGFWATFVSDVQMGDYSTKMVLSDSPW